MASFRVFPLCLIVALGVASSASAAPRRSNQFIASEPTHIPDLTLQPGSYSIQVVGHLSDRYVVRVDGEQSGVHYSFLALENGAIAKPAKPGLVVWDNPADGKRYVRGWYFPGSAKVLEFVYPKGEAVAIAKTNQAKVPAIDPASEGRPVEIKGLSKEDLDVITLWLLSSTSVGPGDSAGSIQAQKYSQVASAERKPVVARLPQTASNLPWIALLSVFAMMAALVLRVVRLSTMRAG